jgi:RNA polymerase sigma-70 factor (ECF subfamily)
VDDPSVSEARLIEQARLGSVTAFDALVRAHQEIAFRTAWVVSGGVDDAEDAAQDAFVKAFGAMRSFRSGATFRPWLLTIVANEARNRRRSAGRRDAARARLTTVSAGVAEPGETTEAMVLASERRSMLLDAMHGLGDADREVIALRHLVGLSEAETAGALGVPPGTVKSRLSRAMDRLRGALVAMEGPA